MLQQTTVAAVAPYFARFTERWPTIGALAQTYPGIALNAMRTMGGRLQDTQSRLREMQTERVERRIAHGIARLVAQAGRRVEGGILIDFPVSRQDIAELTGTTLHTVSRLLSGWEKQGLVKSGRKRIVVCDAHRLVVISGAQLP